MPDGGPAQALAHDARQGDQLGLDGRQDLVVGQEQAVDDGAFHPHEVRPVRAPGGEYGLEVLAVELLEELGAAVRDGGVDVEISSGD